MGGDFNSHVGSDMGGLVKDFKVISAEDVVSQHCLLSMDMVFEKKVRREVKLRTKLKLWRSSESEMKEEFREGVNSKCDGNEDWCGLKRKLLGVVSEVCGYTKGRPRNFESWWWNKDLDVTVSGKRELSRIWN